MQGTTGTHGHAIVLPKDKVDMVQIARIGFHGLDGTLLCLVALQGSNNSDIRVILQGISETVVALDGW